MTLLSIVSLVSLVVIFVFSLVMVLSCYESGFVGALSGLLMAVASAVVCLDFDAYQLSRATVVLELGVAIFLVRHFARFQYFRRRDRQVVELGRWFRA